MAKESYYKVGEVVFCHLYNPPWTRKILEVRENYLGKQGVFGYWYIDGYGIYGLCSEAHLRRWASKGAGDNYA